MYWNITHNFKVGKHHDEIYVGAEFNMTHACSPEPSFDGCITQSLQHSKHFCHTENKVCKTFPDGIMTLCH